VTRETMTNFQRAEQIAQTLRGVTEVSTTSYAVYAHGTNKWVCPTCLTVSNPGPPLLPHHCPCGAVLTP